jgi:hypothetical protein
MKVLFRMITVATSLIWILLIVFTVSAIYCMKDIHLDIGSPQSAAGPNNELIIDFPIGITNNAFYNLENFNISTEIRDLQTALIAQGFTFIPNIERGESINLTYQMTMNLTEFIQNHQNLAVDDTELQANITISMKAAQLIPLQVSSNRTVPWGAPLYNFTLGAPEITMQASPSSMNRCLVTIPMSFENHACFDLMGTIKLSMYNDTNLLTGTGATVLKAPSLSNYKQDVQFEVPAEGTTSNGFLEVSLSTPSFDYGPLVISYGK